MLATFLVGLTLGSALASAAADRLDDPLRWFGLLQLGIGLSGVITLILFAVLPSFIDAMITSDTLAKKTLSEFLGAGLTMILPTILMGAMLPITARIVCSGTRDVGSRMGRLYAVNTTGSMMGALLTGLVLIGAIGLQRSALLLAAVNLSIGSLALLWFTRRARAVVAASLVSALIVALLLPRGVYLGFNETLADKLIFYEEGAEATVSVFEGGSPFIRVSYVNGRSEVPTDPVSMRTFYILGHLPALLKPEARSALMVSFGNGIATGALSRHHIPRIQAVELVEAQTKAARLYFQENRNVLDYPGLSITIDDGRNYVMRSDETFDIITADSTHPINTSSWALFTREFYEQVRERLAADGVFIQWLPFHDLSQDDYRKIIATFRSVFPNTTIWYGGGPHTFMLATPEPLEKDDIEDLESIMRARGVGDDLQDGELLRRAFLMEKEDVERYVSDAPIVHDDTAFFVPAIEVEQVLRGLSLFRTPPRESRP
jgi:spermidine synthase